MVIQDHQFSCHLKANMRLPISDQQQPRPYLAPFSHNTSVTDGRTTTVPKTPTVAVARQNRRFVTLKPIVEF